MNPITKTNWEGVGVKPEVDVPPATALREAHVRAIEELQKNPRDDEHKALLGRALEFTKQAPSENEDDFVRPSRRRAG